MCCWAVEVQRCRFMAMAESWMRLSITWTDLCAAVAKGRATSSHQILYYVMLLVSATSRRPNSVDGLAVRLKGQLAKERDRERGTRDLYRS